MQIQIDLTIGNADIIAFGMLEKAKNTAQAWIIQRRRLMDAAVLNAAEKEKSVIDMFGRKR